LTFGLSSERWDRIDDKRDEVLDDEVACEAWLRDDKAALIWSAMRGPTSLTTKPLIWFTKSLEVSLSFEDEDVDDEDESTAFEDVLERDDFGFLARDEGESDNVSDESMDEVDGVEVDDEGVGSDDNDDVVIRLMCKWCRDNVCRTRVLL
jgi:hypothetical protein